MGGGVSGRGDDSGSNSTKVNWDKQNKHDKQSNNYVNGKSFVTMSKDSVQSFIIEHLPTAQKVGENKYSVHSDKIVGMYIDKMVML